LIIDASTFLVGCSYTGEGIYRSTDAGETWRVVSNSGGSGAPLRASDGSIYWPVRDNLGLMRSTDEGKTWIQAVGPGAVFTVTPVELPDGRIAMLGDPGIVTSANFGKTWLPISVPLPYRDVTGFVYSVQRRAFFIKHLTCIPPSVPADAIMRYDYDYEQS
jgi:photosystem II stability/assembly factor-like uncharacterized protein